MVLGDVSRAVAGYRAALELLTSTEMFDVAPTTLWSLGVALDRAGDLSGGLQSIARAREYDPQDRKLSGDSWFYVRGSQTIQQSRSAAVRFAAT